MNFICEYVDTLLSYEQLLKTKARSKKARKLKMSGDETERLKVFHDLKTARNSYGQHQMTPQEERYIRSVFPYAVPSFTTQSELPYRKYVEEKIIPDAKLILDHDWLSGDWKERELLKTIPSETQIARIRSSFTLVDYIPKSAITEVREHVVRMMAADSIDFYAQHICSYDPKQKRLLTLLAARYRQKTNTPTTSVSSKETTRKISDKLTAQLDKALASEENPFTKLEEEFTPIVSAFLGPEALDHYSKGNTIPTGGVLTEELFIAGFLSEGHLDDYKDDDGWITVDDNPYKGFDILDAPASHPFQSAYFRIQEQLRQNGLFGVKANQNGTGLEFDFDGFRFIHLGGSVQVHIPVHLRMKNRQFRDSFPLDVLTHLQAINVRSELVLGTKKQNHLENSDKPKQSTESPVIEIIQHNAAKRSLMRTLLEGLDQDWTYFDLCYHLNEWWKKHYEVSLYDMNKSDFDGSVFIRTITRTYRKAQIKISKDMLGYSKKDLRDMLNSKQYIASDSV